MQSAVPPVCSNQTRSPCSTVCARKTGSFSWSRKAAADEDAAGLADVEEGLLVLVERGGVEGKLVAEEVGWGLVADVGVMVVGRLGLRSRSPQGRTSRTLRTHSFLGQSSGSTSARIPRSIV